MRWPRRSGRVLQSLSQVAKSSAPWNLAVIAANAATQTTTASVKRAIAAMPEPAAHPRRRECAAGQREERDDRDLDDPRGHRI